MKKIVAFIILFSLLFSNSLTAFAQNEEYDWGSNVTRAAVKRVVGSAIYGLFK